MKNLTLIDKAFLLKRTPLFVNLDLDLLLSIADKLAVIHMKAGEKIFAVNEEASRMYFIVKGEIEVRSSENRTLATLHADDFFGEESLFNHKSRSYEAINKTETQLLTLSKTNLLTIISECPSVAVGLLQVYTSNIGFRPFI